ncbi:MAG: ABC transporter transmembrane domain-containing protein, partial [Halieaceae bacterium]|nr:ABC transporter transmembrane domain-containing protein [Halieaceae bacterium]
MGTGRTPNSREIYFRLLGYIRPHWKIFALGILGMILMAISEAALPALVKPLLDGTFVEKDPLYLAWAPLGVIIVFLFRGLAQVLSGAAFASISTHLNHKLREEMFGNLLQLPSAFFQQNATGKIVSKFTYDVSRISEAGVNVLNALVKDSLIVIGLLAYIIWLDWQLSLLTLLLAPAVATVVKFLGRWQRRLSRQLQTAFGDLTHASEEAIRGQNVVKIFGGHLYEAHRFSKVAHQLRHSQFKLILSSKIGAPIIELVSAGVSAAVIHIGTARAAEEQLTVGGFVAFFAALGLLASPLKRLTQVTYPLQ